MKLKFIETTYVCQLNKPHNRTMLESYKQRKDASPKELANYYRDIVGALYNTPAFGVSGVNKMLNELTTKVRATLNRAKSGKTSAYAHANKLLTTIDRFGNKHADCRYNGNYKLQPLLTEAELIELETLN